jgi:hypothetical protein
VHFTNVNVLRTSLYLINLLLIYIIILYIQYRFKIGKQQDIRGLRIDRLFICIHASLHQLSNVCHLLNESVETLDLTKLKTIIFETVLKFDEQYLCYYQYSNESGTFKVLRVLDLVERKNRKREGQV